MTANPSVGGAISISDSLVGFVHSYVELIMLLRFAIVAIALHAVATPAYAQRGAAVDTAALRREVEQLNRGMEAAFNRGDLKGAAAFYSDDAIVRTNREVIAQGRAAIDRYFMGTTAS